MGMKNLVFVLLGMTFVIVTWVWTQEGQHLRPKVRSATPPANGLKVGIRWLETKDVVFRIDRAGKRTDWILEGTLIDHGECEPDGRSPSFSFSGTLGSYPKELPLRGLIGRSLTWFGSSKDEREPATVCAPIASKMRLVEGDAPSIQIINVEGDVLTFRIFGTFYGVDEPRLPIPVEAVLRARASR